MTAGSRGRRGAASAGSRAAGRGTGASAIPEWLAQRLACPRDRHPLGDEGDALACGAGHRYPIVQGVPVLLVAEADPTHPYCAATVDAVRRGAAPVGGPEDAHGSDGAVDPFVAAELLRTCGKLYRGARLTRYPIPELRLPPGRGRTFLDVGSNWGRWSVSAAQQGYRPVALDPSLDAALAGGRVARQLGVAVGFVVGDARYLPFTEDSFDVGFSYSVLQHFDKHAARQALRELSRTTRGGGQVVVQMANRFGLRQLYNRARQALRRDANPFRMRYWAPVELRRAFAEEVGPARLRVDGFWTLNPQAADLDLLAPASARVVRLSERLRVHAEHRPALAWVADSLYVDATNAKAFRGPAASARR